MARIFLTKRCAWPNSPTTELTYSHLLFARRSVKLHAKGKIHFLSPDRSDCGNVNLALLSLLQQLQDGVKATGVDVFVNPYSSANCGEQNHAAAAAVLAKLRRGLQNIDDFCEDYLLLPVCKGLSSFVGEIVLNERTSKEESEQR
tara:strand:+ start:284 stop:718 length:435 start_codon:yes stop_codon:yes gene_type:complete